MKFTKGILLYLQKFWAAATARTAGRLSFVAVPACILISALMAVLLFQDRYPHVSGQALPFQLASETSAQAWAPAQARTMLAEQPTAMQAQAHGAFWLRVSVPPTPSDVPRGVYLPLPLAASMACYDADTLAPRGQATRSEHQSFALMPIKLGFAAPLMRSTLQTDLLCRVQVAEEGEVSLELWNLSSLHQSADLHNRSVGLLEGGLLTIALFMVIIAVTNREWLYVLLAAWLVGNLRVGSQVLGWDTYWLGYAIPLDWMPLTRRLTLAVYYLLSYALFTRLFERAAHDSPPGPRLRWAINLARWGGLLLLAAAVVLPNDTYNLLARLICSFGLLLGTWLLAGRLLAADTKVWLWQVVLLGMALCVIASGVAVMVFGRTDFLNMFNSVVVLLLSSVTVALAVAERIRHDSDLRLRVQAELVGNFALAPIGTFTLNAQGVVERANPVFEQMLDCQPAEQVVRWTDYFEQQDWAALAARTAAGEEAEVNLRREAQRPDLPQHFIVRAALAGHRVEGSLQDITARTETIRQLRLMADNDPLTNVYNRRGIEKALDTALRDLADGHPCSIAYLDLERFDRINGLFGHTTGDEVLKQVSDHLRQQLRPRDAVGRIGGDEFILLFPDTRADEACSLAQALVEALNSTVFSVDNRSFHIHSAVGVVELNHNMTAADAMSAANRACRDARKRREEIVVYQHDSNELLAHTEELRLFDQLEGGSSPRGLYLEMQPILDLRAPLHSLNFEVLLRVRDSSGSLIPTGKVVASAEESGTITIIDKWVFSATLEWLDKHASRLHRSRLVNLNLSGVSLNDNKFVDAFFAILSSYEHLAERLCVEITEGVALQDLDRTRRFMRRLQGMGAHIALDDFGAGYTSFSYLKRLAADIIKIDGALIRDMRTDKTNIAIVRTIVELAHNLDMKCIAEWVEDHETLTLLHSMNVDYVQGWAVSKARSPAEILGATDITSLINDPDTLDILRRIS